MRFDTASAESGLFYLLFWEEFMTALPQKRPFSVVGPENQCRLIFIASFAVIRHPCIHDSHPLFSMFDPHLHLSLEAITAT